MDYVSTSAESTDYWRQHDGPDSSDRTANSRNVGRKEQLGSILAGGSLIAYGMLPKGKFRLISLLAGASLVYRGFSGTCEIYKRLGIDTTEEVTPGVDHGQGRKIVSVLHINRDSRDLYDLWRNLSNLPNVMRHIESVTALDDRRSHWVAKGPLNQSIEWDAEIIADRAGELIAWQSLPGAVVENAGSVRFEQPHTGEGTVLRVTIKYDPPGGWTVAKLANLLGSGLQQEVDEDLRRFKQLMETGETATAAMNGSQS